MGVRQKSESDTIVVKLKNKTLTTTPAFAYAYLRCRIATRGTIYLIATYTTAWNKFTTFPLVSIGVKILKKHPQSKTQHQTSSQVIAIGAAVAEESLGLARSKLNIRERQRTTNANNIVLRIIVTHLL